MVTLPNSHTFLSDRFRLMARRGALINKLRNTYIEYYLFVYLPIMNVGIYLHRNAFRCSQEVSLKISMAVDYVCVDPAL